MIMAITLMVVTMIEEDMVVEDGVMTIEEGEEEEGDGMMVTEALMMRAQTEAGTEAEIEIGTGATLEVVIDGIGHLVLGEVEEVSIKEEVEAEAGETEGRRDQAPVVRVHQRKQRMTTTGHNVIDTRSV